MLEKKYATDHDGTYSYIDPVTVTVCHGRVVLFGFLS
jgi:hypothetical protein